jgi:uncharacterized protein YdaT
MEEGYKNKRGIYPTCSKEKDWSQHTLRCEGTKICSDEIVEKRFRDTDAERAIRMTAGCKNKEHLHKTATYISK